ncbi:MAG: AAA family ATPase, partial [Planctomycetota bacterium]
LEHSLAGLEERASQAEREVETRNRDLDEAEELAAGARVREEELRERREGDLIQESECRMKIEAIRGGLAEELEIDLSTAPVADWREELRREAGEPEGLEELLRLLTEELERVQDRLRRNASVNLEAVKELEELEERNRFLAEQIDDLQGSRKSLLDTIEALNRSSRERFVEAFEVVRGHFRDVFASIFSGGSADLRLEEGVDLLEAGVEVVARPPGKRISSLGLLSGGEKALTAISVLFALFRTKPSPFCILDEVDAPLDESNIRRFVRVLMEFAESSQFLIITHSKVTMAEAERLYGVTMEEEGVSRKVAVRLEEVESFQERASSPTGVPI